MKKKGKSTNITAIIFVIVLFVVTFAGSYLGNIYFDKMHSNKKDASKNYKVVDKVIVNPEVEIAYNTESKVFVAHDGLFKISNSMHYPKQITIEKKAEEKMLKLLKERITFEYEGVNTTAKEQIENYDNTFDPSLDGFPSPYGVSFAYNHENISAKVITFALNTTGSMDGVSWDGTKLYNYAIDNGEIVKLEDVCLDINKCKESMSNFFIEELKKDERFPNLNPDYENIVKEKLFEDGSWGFSKGLKMVISKYEIADGAQGLFTYTIPVDKTNELLKDDYKIK